MKIASWNVNSINSRIDHLKLFLKKNDIDIVLLQELKCINEKFPYLELENIGYNCYVNGQKGWNGVAILSKKKIEIINSKIPNFTNDLNSILCLSNSSKFFDWFSTFSRSEFSLANSYRANAYLFVVVSEKVFFELKLFPFD